jgi:hypothetical protein
MWLASRRLPTPGLGECCNGRDMRQHKGLYKPLVQAAPRTEKMSNFGNAEDRPSSTCIGEVKNGGAITPHSVTSLWRGA